MGTSQRDRAVESIKADCMELRKIFAQVQNTQPNLNAIRRYEWLAWEKAKEQIKAEVLEQGKPIDSVANPYEVGNDR